MNTINFLAGKKTYLTGLAALVLLFGSWQHWWTIPSQIYEALMALAVIFLRAGVAKDAGSTPSVGAPGKVSSSLGKIPIMAFACFLLICGTGVFITGCGTTTPQQVTYQTAGTITVSVDTAMKEWGAYVAATHPPASQEQAVKSAYEKYQAAMAAVCDAGAIYSATSSTNAPAASLALQQAIGNADQEITDLENLISSFGVKL